MNEGLIAAMAHFEDFDEEHEPLPSPEEDFEDFECNQDDFAFVATHPSDPKMFDKALRGPDSKHWEEAL